MSRKCRIKSDHVSAAFRERHELEPEAAGRWRPAGSAGGWPTSAGLTRAPGGSGGSWRVWTWLGWLALLGLSGPHPSPGWGRFLLHTAEAGEGGKHGSGPGRSRLGSDPAASASLCWAWPTAEPDCTCGAGTYTRRLWGQGLRSPRKTRDCREGRRPGARNASRAPSRRPRAVAPLCANGPAARSVRRGPKGLRCLRGPVSRSAPRACSLPLLLSGALPIFSTVSALEREVTSEVVCSPPHVGSGASARGLPGASRGPFSSPTSASPRPALSSLSRPPVQEEWTLLCPELGTAHTGTWCAGLVGTGRLRITRSS